MSFLDAYTFFGSVIVVGVLIVMAGVLSFVRLPSRLQLVLAVLWLAVHAAALATNAGGLLLTNLLVIGSAVFGAGLIARAARTPGALAALAVTASVVDITSFHAGPTRWLLSSDSGGAATVLRYLAVTVPVDGSPIPVVGIGDLVLFGAFLLGLREFGCRPWAAAGVLATGLLIALAVGLARGGAFGIPFMAVGVLGFVVFHRRASQAKEQRP